MCHVLPCIPGLRPSLSPNPACACLPYGASVLLQDSTSGVSHQPAARQTQAEADPLSPQPAPLSSPFGAPLAQEPTMHHSRSTAALVKDGLRLTGEDGKSQTVSLEDLRRMLHQLQFTR